MPRWNSESRQRQSEQIQQWKPWQDSTGPRSQHGKQMSRRNRQGTGDPRRIQMLAAMGLLKCLELEQELGGVLDAEALKDLDLAESILREFAAGEVEPPQTNELFQLP